VAKPVIEFECRGCDRHIVEVIAERVPEPPLCVTCLHIPGWTQDEALCAIFDPGRPWPWPKAPA